MEPPAAAWSLAERTGSRPGLAGRSRPGGGQGRRGAQTAAQGLLGAEVRAGRREPCALSLAQRGGRYG